MTRDEMFRGKRVLVFGHTGFKGAWLCHWLNLLGAEVTGFSLGEVSEPSLFRATGLALEVDSRFGNIQDQKAVKDVVDSVQPDFVFHMAAQALVRQSYRDPVDTTATNVMGTAHVLDALRGYEKPCAAVIVTSDKCYENVEWTWGYRENDRLGGVDPYSASKGAAEVVFQSFARSFFATADSLVRCASARAGNVIGGGDWAADRIVPDAMRAWSKGQTVQLRRPNATRPWQHVLEPLSGYLRLAQALAGSENVAGESFNFGPSASQDKSVMELLLALGEQMITLPGAGRISVDEDVSGHEAGLLKLCCDKALRELQWQARLDFGHCARMTAEWYAAFYAGGDVKSLTMAQIKDYESRG